MDAAMPDIGAPDAVSDFAVNDQSVDITPMSGRSAPWISDMAVQIDAFLEVDATRITSDAATPRPSASSGGRSGAVTTGGVVMQPAPGPLGHSTPAVNGTTVQTDGSGITDERASRDGPLRTVPAVDVLYAPRQAQ